MTPVDKMNQERVPRHRIAATIRSFFALNSSMIALLAMVVLVGMGEKMAERFLPLYLMAVGGTTWAVGSLNGMDNLLSALYSFPGGYLSDLLGYKKALIVFNLVAMVGVCDCHSRPHVVGGPHRCCLLHLMDGDLPACDHVAGQQGCPKGQAHNGCQPPLADTAHPHGPGATRGWRAHPGVRTHQGCPDLVRGCPLAGGRGHRAGGLLHQGRPGP